MSGCDFEHDDGAYVLGALSPEDRVAFERHLADCPGCARSVRELAGLPGLMARVPVEVLDPGQAPPPVPDTLLPGLVRRSRRSRRRRAWVAGGLVAAAAVVAIGAVGVATLGDDTPGTPSAGGSPSAAPTTATALPFRPVGAEPISGWVSLTPVGWGTRLDLTCSYAEEEGNGGADYSDPALSSYSMVLTRVDGSQERVASWKALPGKTMHLAAATAALRDDITAVEVLSASGRTVLELHD